MLSELLILSSLAATQLTTLQPSHLVMEGSSNLSQWRCNSGALDAKLETAQSLDEINAAVDRIARETSVPVAELPMPRFSLLIPIAAIRCGNRLMEREMLRSLRGREHPSIEFHLREVTREIRHEVEGNRFLAEIAGDLSVAGATRRLAIQLQGWRLSRDSFYVRAAVPLRMSDFGVTPPTALFGLIRARDDIVVYFDLRLSATAKEDRD